MEGRRWVRSAVLAATVMVLPTSAAAGTSSPAVSDCPQRSPAVPVHQAWAPANLTIAPAGATSVRVCRYSGLNAHPPLRLTAGVLIRDRAEVDRIVWRLDRLTAGPTGPVACPSDDLSQIRVVLAYPGRRTVPVSVGLAGCGIVTNGAVNRTVAGVGNQPGPLLIRELKADARRAARPLR